MATNAGRESALVFADALAGSDGMAEVSYSTSLSAAVYPDALSVLSVAPLRAGPPARPGGAPLPAAVAPPANVPGLNGAGPRAAPLVRGAPVVRPVSVAPRNARSVIVPVRSAAPRQGSTVGSAAKGSVGAWGFLVVLIVLLVTTGAGQKIISLITDVLQRR